MENNINPTLAAALSRLITRQRNTPGRFSLPLKCDMVAQQLANACRAEVAQRGKTMLDEPAVAEHCRQMAEVLTGGDTHFGCMLAGRVGSGKTTMMFALQRLLAALGRVGVLPFGTGLRVVSSKDIHCTDDQRARFRLLCDDELLGIDDLGTEPREEMNFGTVTTPIIDLMEYRYARRLFTVITTNLTPKERLDCYGSRFADRSREMFRTIVFDHDSYR